MPSTTDLPHSPATPFGHLSTDFNRPTQCPTGAKLETFYLNGVRDTWSFKKRVFGSPSERIDPVPPGRRRVWLDYSVPLTRSFPTCVSKLFDPSSGSPRRDFLEDPGAWPSSSHASAPPRSAAGKNYRHRIDIFSTYCLFRRIIFL